MRNAVNGIYMLIEKRKQNLIKALFQLHERGLSEGVKLGQCRFSKWGSRPSYYLQRKYSEIYGGGGSAK